MPVTNFLQGLLGGLATGMVEGSIRQKNEEFLQERQRMATAAELLKSGNYEAFALVDPKLHKAMGLEGDSLQAIQALAGMQRQTRQRQQQKEEVQLKTAQQQQRITDIDLGNLEEEQKLPPEQRKAGLERRTAAAKAGKEEFSLEQAKEEEKRINALPPDKQLIARYPNIANYDLQVKKFEAEKAARAQEHEEKMEQYKVQLQKLNEQITETKRHHAAVEGNSKEAIDERKRAAKELEDYRRDQKDLQEEIKKAQLDQKKLDSANVEYNRAVQARDKVRATAPVETKIGRNSHPVFSSESDAQEFVFRMNAAEARVDKAEKILAKIQDREPDAPFKWRYHSDSGGFLGLGTKHIALAEQGGSSTSNTQTGAPPASDALRDKLNKLNPQGGSQPQPSVTETTTDNPIRTYTPESGPTPNTHPKVGMPLGEAMSRGGTPAKQRNQPKPETPESSDPNTPKYIAEFKKNAPKELRYNPSAIARYVELRRSSKEGSATVKEIIEYVDAEIKADAEGKK
jgi:hypothetical protein